MNLSVKTVMQNPGLNFLETLVFIIGLCLTYDVLANNSGEVLVKSDFAYGVEFSPNNKQALQALTLSEHFYQNTVNPNGGDFRIFDANGQEMPFTIKTAHVNIKDIKKNKLEFYPVYGKTEADLNALSFSLEKENISLLINDQKSEQTNDTSLLGYIIDTGELENIVGFSFDWSKPEVGFIDDIVIEQSDDLISWSSILNKASLSRLNHLGSVIGNDRLMLSSRNTERYLRMTWGADTKEFLLKSVISESQVLFDALSNQQKSMVLTLDKVDSSTDLPSNTFADNSYLLSVGGTLPVTGLEFVDVNENYFFRADLFALSNGYEAGKRNQFWKNRGDINQYHLHVGQKQIKSDATTFDPIKYPVWLFSFNEPRAFNTSGPPRVKVTWLPEKLLFIAKGEAPYTLAYGNPGVQKARHDLSSIVGQLNSQEWVKILAQAADLSTPAMLGGEAKLQAPKTGFPWKTICLWLVLVLGVGVLARMCWILFKQGEVTHKNIE